MITFKPKAITKKLLSVLPPRARDVLVKRYGLGDDETIYTLEAIGKLYGITRERVRQIENYGIQSIQKSEAYKEFADAFAELQSIFTQLGGAISESELLSLVAKDNSTKNHIYLILTVGEPFKRVREDSEFTHRWYLERRVVERVEKSLRCIFKNLDPDDLVSEEEMIERLRAELSADEPCVHDESVIRRWLSMSKLIDRNPLGEWGHATSPNVRAKGIRDYAYLAVKRHGSPMHYREVSEAIQSLFNRKAHIATTHNELIKDQRFVLVGRGLYALSEWGYSAGVVKDVLRDILVTHGPLTRDEIIAKVRKERYVKDNTIIVNLQDTALFKKLPDGNYMLVD